MLPLLRRRDAATRDAATLATRDSRAGCVTGGGGGGTKKRARGEKTRAELAPLAVVFLLFWGPFVFHEPGKKDICLLGSDFSSL